MRPEYNTEMTMVNDLTFIMIIKKSNLKPHENPYSFKHFSRQIDVIQYAVNLGAGGDKIQKILRMDAKGDVSPMELKVTDFRFELVEIPQAMSTDMIPLAQSSTAAILAELNEREHQVYTLDHNESAQIPSGIERIQGPAKIVVYPL